MKKIQKIKSNVSIIIGTRPEAIKLAPLIKTFKSFKNIKLRVILSGQHKEMVYEIMDLFNLKIGEATKFWSCGTLLEFSLQYNKSSNNLKF